jgi:hypothetical protein
VEFLASAGVLAALLGGIVVLGKLQDLQSATVAASRYAAFERAMHGDRLASGVLAGHVRARFYERADTPVRSADVRTDATAWRSIVSHWTDRTARGMPLVARPADVQVITRESDPPGAAARLASGVATVADRAALLSGGRFDVNRRGYHAAEVSVRVAPLVAEAPPLSRLSVTFRESTTMLGDGWGASGPEHVARRTAAFVPTARLQAVRPALGALRWALRLIEPSIDALCLGRIDPELVPADRLGPPGSGDRGTWVAPC